METELVKAQVSLGKQGPMWSYELEETQTIGLIVSSPNSPGAKDR